MKLCMLIAHLILGELLPCKSNTGTNAKLFCRGAKGITMEQWYYIRDQKKVGPVGREHLQQLRATGQLRPMDMVMKVGAQRWRAAGEVAELLDGAGANVSALATAQQLLSAASQWFYIQDQKKCGPVETTYLRLLVLTGELLVNDMVLRDGECRWRYAGDVPDLFQAADLESYDDDETEDEEIDVDWHLERAAEFKARGNYVRAVREYQTLVQLLPDEPEGYQGLAWVWATCSEVQFRDGPRAVEYAARAIALAEQSDEDVRVALAVTCQETLAAALAEAGKFEEAVAVLDQAIAQAPKAEQARLRFRRALYQGRKPFREGGRVLSDTRHEMQKPLP